VRILLLRYLKSSNLGLIILVIALSSNFEALVKEAKADMHSYFIFAKSFLILDVSDQLESNLKRSNSKCIVVMAFYSKRWLSSAVTKQFPIVSTLQRQVLALLTH
jgi:hypothetical protein